MAKLTLEATLARNRNLQLVRINKKDQDERQREAVAEKAYQTWLQTQYPVTLARRCMSFLSDKTVQQSHEWTSEVNVFFREHKFARQMVFKNIWECDKLLTMEYASCRGVFDCHPHKVRCALPFQELIETSIDCGAGSVAKDPVEILAKLFKKCIPLSEKIFHHSYNPHRLLHMNDWCLEKAFVYGILCLSKWMLHLYPPGKGLSHWPPKPPDELVFTSKTRIFSSIYDEKDMKGACTTHLSSSSASASISAPGTLEKELLTLQAASSSGSNSR